MKLHRPFRIAASALLSFVVFFAAKSDTSLKVHGHKNLPRFREGEVLVKLSPRIKGVAGRSGVAARHGMRRASAVKHSELVRMTLAPGEGVEDTVKRLQSDPDVELAQPNFLYHIAATPNDTSYGDLWGLNNTGQTVASGSYSTNNPGTSGKDLDAESAWDKITDCSSVTVAVIDTGVNYNHLDLTANMWNGGVPYPNHGYDFVSSDDDPMDTNGHGTHVAGIIGARGNNALGVAGVCWTASIMAIRVLDTQGTGATADIVSGVNFAVAQGAKVINMSLGGGSYDASLNTAIQSAGSSGVAVIVAAGNDGTNNDATPVYPCNITASNLLCVAALDQSYALASFSNYGLASVDVGAPGTNIVSSVHGTVTTLTDTLTTWTVNDANWAHQTISFGGTPYDVLTNPTNWDGSTTSYLNNLDSRAYKTFDLSGTDAAVLSYYAFVNTESGVDLVKAAYHSGGADPFAGAGTTMETLSGDTGTSALNYTYDLNSCRTATCVIGYQLTSNAATVSRGAAVVQFEIEKTVLNTTSYDTYNGTSMATPYVAGIANMLFAYNPNYTMADVINSIKKGAVSTTSLPGYTTTGKAASVLGALSYINSPTGVAVTVQ